MDKYAVFGHPIKQSKSPQIHRLFASQTCDDISYQAIEAPVDGFADSLNLFFSQHNARGCNVTAPFKQEAAKWVDELSDTARLAGSVNTIQRRDDGRYAGHNTDGIGLVNDLKANQVQLSDARILLLGAGGAARGVIQPLLTEVPASLTIANRTLDKALAVKQVFQSERLHVSALDQLGTAAPFDVIINSTSASLHGQLPPVAPEIVAKAKCVYDMAYASEPTVFMQWATRLGAPETLDGLGMLVGQAAQSYRIWRGKQPDEQAVLEQLRSELAG